MFTQKQKTDQGKIKLSDLVEKGFKGIDDLMKVVLEKSPPVISQVLVKTKIYIKDNFVYLDSKGDLEIKERLQFCQVTLSTLIWRLTKLDLDFKII